MQKNMIQRVYDEIAGRGETGKTNKKKKLPLTRVREGPAIPGKNKKRKKEKLLPAMAVQFTEYTAVPAPMPRLMSFPCHIRRFMLRYNAPISIPPPRSRRAPFLPTCFSRKCTLSFCEFV